MDEPWQEIQDDCLRFTRELVERVVELGVDCATFTIASEGKTWRVSVDEVDAKGNVIQT